MGPGLYPPSAPPHPGRELKVPYLRSGDGSQNRALWKLDMASSQDGGHQAWSLTPISAIERIGERNLIEWLSRKPLFLSLSEE